MFESATDAVCRSSSLAVIREIGKKTALNLRPLQVVLLHSKHTHAVTVPARRAHAPLHNILRALAQLGGAVEKGQQGGICK